MDFWIIQRFIVCLLVFLCIVVSTNQEIIPYGSQQIFDLFHRVSVTDLKNTNGYEATYEVKSLITINSIWNSMEFQLLEIFFSETTVSTPRASPKEFKNAFRNIQKINEKPFYVTIIEGKPHQVIAHSSHNQSFLNLIRGMASLLQFVPGTVKESDVSGECTTYYSSKSSTKFEKIKIDCSHWDLKVNYRSEMPLEVWKKSKHQIFFDLTSEGFLLNTKSYEIHEIGLNSKPDVGSHLESELTLNHRNIIDDQIKQISFETLDEAVNSLLENFRVFDIEADIDGAVSEIHDTTLKQQIAMHKKKLMDQNIKKEDLAVLTAELLPVARITKTREFIEILSSETDQIIRKRLIDLLGAVQTIDAHQAILTHYKIDDNDADDYFESYLQSLAIGTHPDRAIVENLFIYLRDKEYFQNEKILDTLIQTIASLARPSTLGSNDKLLTEIREYFIDNIFKKCSEIECKTRFIRALQNLQDAKIISLLMSLAKDKVKKISVAAVNALKSFPINTFSNEHRQQLEAMFLQTSGKFDSSARTIALDILLEMRPNKKQLEDLIDYLSSNDPNFEVKSYLLQKVRVISEKCPRFAALYSQILRERSHVNNYDILAQKGLTTAFYRQLSKSPSFNESLFSVQEIHKGILKRGSVELILSAEAEEINTFKLGIHTSGLSSFVSDNNKNFEDDEIDGKDDEEITAGMDISVQGVLFRPLIFFEGQTELMGHIWSGTASEPTTAYQATILTQDHEKYILLQSGATVYVRFLGAKSIDLSGQVTMSIWNRNAHTEINQSTGTGIVGLMTVGTFFAKLEHKIILSSNPQIHLIADSDFYTDTKLCVQLSRPEMHFTLLNIKSVFLQAKQKFEKEIKTKTYYIFPGSTLALNRKNNEMCNMILP